MLNEKIHMTKLVEMMFCFTVNSEFMSMKKTSKDSTLDFFQKTFFPKICVAKFWVELISGWGSSEVCCDLKLFLV